MHLKKKLMKKLLFIIGLVVTFSSCTTINKSIKQPFSSVDIRMDDFNLSEQKTAKATSVTVMGIDFERLFLKKMGPGSTVSSIPVLGQYLSDATTSYAMYNLLEENDGADFIFYPQIEKKITCPILGICLINRVSTVEVKSKLGTFK